MKLLFVIDHLGLGGAQRQMVELACGLAQRGHAVEFFVYHPQHDFFANRLESAAIKVHKFRKGRGFSFTVIWKLAALMRTQDFDLVLAFLNYPVMYAEIARFIARKPVLVVSERASRHDDRSAVAAAIRRMLHHNAELLVSNSEAHAAWLRTHWWLSRKVATIYNGFDLNYFIPSTRRPVNPQAIRLLAVGRICPQKNLVTLIRGLGLFHRRNGYAPSVSWVGKRDIAANGDEYGDLVLHTLDGFPEVKKEWRWLGEQHDMRPILREHDALIHPSRYEGLPNAVCEALASGMPVLVSDVCDHPLLVADGKRGFLFNPESPESIAAALQKLVDLAPIEWCEFSADGRRFVEGHLGLDRMVAAYATLFSGLTRGDCKNP